MQNADNLRTLIGRKGRRPPNARPCPNIQDNAQPKKLKTKKFSHLLNKNLSWKNTQLRNNPNSQQPLAAPTNLVTISLPGPANTLTSTSGSGPNNPTGPINTNETVVSESTNPSWLINNPGQIGVRPIDSINTSGQMRGNRPSNPINTPGQMRGIRPVNQTRPNSPIWSNNILGQGRGGGPKNPPRPINPVGQTNRFSGPASGQHSLNWSTNPIPEVTGRNSPSRPGNALQQPGETNKPTGINIQTQSGAGIPNWSNNPSGLRGSGMNNPYRPENPLEQAMKTQPNNPGPNTPFGSNKTGPRNQTPQKEEPIVNVISDVTLPTTAVVSEESVSKQTKDVVNWMKSIRDLEDKVQSKNKQRRQGLLPTPEMETHATKSMASTNNVTINLDNAVFARPKRPRIPESAFRHSFPAGIPRSFIVEALQANLNEQLEITTNHEVPTWYGQSKVASSTPTFAPMPGQALALVTNDPIVQTDGSTEIQQPYSPSDVYDESLGDDQDGSESDLGQSAQKRLSAFQRLGPLSQPKKPKLTINLMFNKEQAVREVVDTTEEDAEKYTPVHLRPSVIASTDETVVKFLPIWPWKKRVSLRKSVTYRDSKSGMLMEQEQMEEIYDKDNVFMQVTVKRYPKNWNRERILDTLLEVVKGKSFIPCFIEFTEDECKFLVLRSRPALVMFHKCGFVVHKDDNNMTIVISQTELSLKLIDFIPRLILRKRLMLRYDGERKLDLKKFTLKDDISHFIYYPLNRITNQIELIQLQNTIAWDYLTDLDLSYNRLTSISGLDLSSTTPRLKHLNLSHNYIEKVTELIKCRGLSINSIWLEGNPLCHDYIDSQHYIKVLKMIFSGLTEIDGVPITMKGEPPSIIRNYCPEDAMELAEKFLGVYFPLLDSAPDGRQFIQNMYADDATMTITYRNKLRCNPVYRCFRNLFLRSRVMEEGEMESVETSSSIVKLINRWPEFEHDPLTFTVDVMHYDDFSAILRVGGIVKLKSESLAEEEYMLAFTKTFVLRSNNAVEYKIQNELIYWDQPTEDSAATAFKLTTVTAKQMSFKLDSAPSEDLKNKLLDLFMNITLIDRASCERCLELKNWNFKDALEYFTKLVKLDSLESLTPVEVL